MAVQRGFSLLETLITLAVAALFFGVLLPSIVTNLDRIKKDKKDPSRGWRLSSNQKRKIALPARQGHFHFAVYMSMFSSREVNHWYRLRLIVSERFVEDAWHL